MQAAHTENELRTATGSLQRIAAGDFNAYEWLFKTYYGVLCHHALGYTGDAAAAEDAVSEVFARLWERRSQLNIETSAKSYLYRAVGNQCIDTLRKSYHRKTVLAENVAVFNHPPAGAGLDELSEAKELSQRIEEAIRRLPRQCGIVFRLSREAGLKYHQIAAELGVSVKTVETQMGRAFKSLRAALRPAEAQLRAA